MRVRPLVAAVLVVLACLSAEAAAADPGAPGPYPVQRLSYRLAPLRVPDFRRPLEVEAQVTVPVGAPGARPVVFVLHGMHRTCRNRRGQFSDHEVEWPCPKGWTPVRNDRGYGWLTRTLASQGDIAVSISANAVNAQNNDVPASGADERTLLLRHHLRLWTRWATDGGDPWGGALRGSIDPSRVVLVGHSRGGEGVAQAAAATRADDPWRIRGLALIAPTAFGRQVTPGVDTVTLLPYCDGDVNDLEGQVFVDNRRDLTADGAIRSAVLILGANHNFFNTVWATDGSTPDDWGSGVLEGDGPRAGGPCSSRRRGRLTGSQQRDIARAYIGALVRASTDDDPEAIAMLTGTAPPPASAGRVAGSRVLVSQWGGGDRLLYAPRHPGRVAGRGGATARVCRGYVRTTTGGCADGIGGARIPHWVQMGSGGPYPAPLALEVRWRTRGAQVWLPVRGGQADATGVPSVGVRVILDGALRGQRLALRLADADGRGVLIPAAGRAPRRLPGPRGDTDYLLPKLWAQTLRFPLDPAALDLSRITRAALVARSARGHAWVLDVTLQGTPSRPATPVSLPVLRVGRARIRERGDRGARTVMLPVLADRPFTVPARVAVQVTDGGLNTRWRTRDLRVGDRGFTVPVRVTSDDERTGNRRYMVSVVALRETAVARYVGWVDVKDDEPARPRSHR